MNYFSAPPRATRQISKFPKHHEALNRCKYRFFVGNVSEVPSQKLTELEKANEEEEVLRTRIVPVAEFLRETDCWKEAIEAEMKQLFEEKEALEKSSLKNLPKEKERGYHGGVDTVKIGYYAKAWTSPQNPYRIVACGNFVENKVGEELFAPGADASALWMLLKAAAEERWSLLTVDIRVAFLNAPLTTTTKDGELTDEEVVFALKPPEDVSPIKNGGFPLLCQFTRG